MNHHVSNIKSESICAVMEALTKNQFMSREDLSHQCQLSLTTVSNILNGLHDYGLLSQKHLHTGKSGRNPTVFSFSDSAAMLMLRINDHALTMTLMDFRMNSLLCLNRNILPDRDPGEVLLHFMLLCRDELPQMHRRIILCGLLNESHIWDNDTIDRAIHTYWKLSVILHDTTHAALARAALHQGIATHDQCTAILSHDNSFEGLILHHGKILRGNGTEIRRDHTDPITHTAELLTTIDTLSAFLSPDAIVICTMQDAKELQKHITEALQSAASKQFEIAVRNTDQFLAYGMALAIRLSWIEEARCDMHRLRDEEDNLPSPISI